MKNKEKIEISKQIDAYIRGKLSKREIDSLWLQFLKNPNYYELFETELHLKKLTQNKWHSGELIIDKRDRKTSIKLWIMAAAATVIVALTIQFYITESESELDSLALSFIAYNEMAAGNVDRSDDEHTISVETDMNRAMAAAYMSNADESMEIFNDLKGSVANESQRARIEFNLAILHYNRSEFELARKSFITVKSSNAIDDIYVERAWWFLANTYLKLNDEEEAMEAIRNVKLLDGKNRDLASALLETLNKRAG